MNYFAALSAIALMGAITTAAIYRGDSISWEAKYNERVAQEQTAEQTAKEDAAKQEQADLKNLQSQSSKALQSAQAQSLQAQTQLQDYKVKLAEASKAKDLPHLCSSIPIPADLLPGQR